MKLLLLSCWLSRLLFIVSTAALVFHPDGLKPRDLTTDTGVSLPSTIPLPSPTVDAKETSALTSPDNPTSTIPPSSTSSDASTPTVLPVIPAPKPSTFYLVVANTGSPFDGSYIFVDMYGPRFPLFGLTDPGPVEDSLFSLNVDGTLFQVGSGLIACYYDSLGGFMFETPNALASSSMIRAACLILSGRLACQNGMTGTFYAFSQTIMAAIPSVKFGLMVPVGAYAVTLLVVAA